MGGPSTITGVPIGLIWNPDSIVQRLKTRYSNSLNSNRGSKKNQTNRCRSFTLNFKQLLAGPKWRSEFKTFGIEHHVLIHITFSISDIITYNIIQVCSLLGCFIINYGVAIFVSLPGNNNRDTDNNSLGPTTQSALPKIFSPG